MKKEVAEQIFREKGIKFIPKYKKIWFSISKFEKYPEMATEGVGRAIGYLAFLMFIFSLILVIILTFLLNLEIKQYINYVEENISIVEYQNGILNIEFENQDNYLITNKVFMIIDTGDIDNEQLTKYQNLISENNMGAIWLKDRVIVNDYGSNYTIYYQDAFSVAGITGFDKVDLVNFLNNILKDAKTYLVYFATMLGYTFVIFFVLTLINVFLLCIFGIITAFIAKLKMRYRAIFNMSIYAITLSTILQLIYILVNLFTNFEIKYFDIMYSAISYICLTAAIFMIKSDVIKQQIEMIKIAKEKQEENIQKEEEEKKEEKETNEEDKEDKKETTEENEKTEEKGKKDTSIDKKVEGQGSNA